MAIRTYLNFTVQFMGDGSDTTFTIVLATGPVGLVPPGSGGALSPLFTGTPVDVSDLGASGGLEISSSSYALGVLSVTFSSAPTADTAYTLGGRALYSA